MLTPRRRDHRRGFFCARAEDSHLLAQRGALPLGARADLRLFVRLSCLSPNYPLRLRFHIVAPNSIIFASALWS
jgi:hypothetical protein